jgi:hypothetical protein
MIRGEINNVIEDMDPERHNVFEIIRQTILSGQKDAAELTYLRITAALTVVLC